MIRIHFNANSYGISTLSGGTLPGSALAFLSLILVLCRGLRLIQNGTFLFPFIALVLDNFADIISGFRRLQTLRDYYVQIYYNENTYGVSTLNSGTWSGAATWCIGWRHLNSDLRSRSGILYPGSMWISLHTDSPRCGLQLCVLMQWNTFAYWLMLIDQYPSLVIISFFALTLHLTIFNGEDINLVVPTCRFCVTISCVPTDLYSLYCSLLKGKLFTLV